jgi:large subunit ribosomal protein L29
MSVEQFRGLDTAELKKALAEGEENMFRIRFQMSLGQTEGIKKLRELKKDRARILTVLREAELAAQKEGK